MSNPRPPGIGETGADVALASDDVASLSDSSFSSNDALTRRAAALDRVADLELAHGHHNAAEMLARKAEVLRAGGAA